MQRQLACAADKLAGCFLCSFTGCWGLIVSCLYMLAYLADNKAVRASVQTHFMQTFMHGPAFQSLPS
jgi:hypothetical protein